MNPLRVVAIVVLFLGTSAALASDSGGFVDGAMFRSLIDDARDVVEVNLDGAILQALAKLGDGDRDTAHSKDLFAKLKSIHAVIGTVKGPAAAALAVVQKTDQALVAAGWQRVTRITDATSTVSVLTHTVAERVDGLVALIFNSEDKELVFANLAGEIGKRFNVPGLDQVPGAH